jgi:outer membrane protein assembly factor BamB
MSSRVVHTGFFVAIIAAVPLQAADWPQWRGPAGQGISPEQGLPTAWGPSSNIEWRTPLPGRGHSSPVTWGDVVFVTAAVEGPAIPGAGPVKHTVDGEPFVHPDSLGGNRQHTLKVLALDRRSGRLLWDRTAYEGRVFDDRHRVNTYASPTPVTDGRRIYAFFGAEGLYAYTVEGELAWKASLGQIRTLGLGVGASPVLHRNILIVQCDEDMGHQSFIAGLDTATGKVVWKRARPVQASWSTPVLVQAGGRTELVTNGNEWVISYDPATGRELWRVPGVQSNAIHTPLIADGLVVVTAGFPDKRTIAIRPGPETSLKGAPRIAWRYDKGTAYVTSNLAYDRYVYLLSDGGIMTCLEASTGKVVYEGGRVPVPARFMASPVAFEGKILLLSEEGDTFVVRSGPKHEILGVNKLGEAAYASPAISNGRILIRTETALYSIANGG